MEFDPFEIHMQLVALLRKLSASHQSIDNVVAFLVRYRDRCADDLWECVTDECQKGSLNTRINILYLLDTLLTTLQDLPAPSVAVPLAPSSSYAHQQLTTAAVAAESYPEWLARDLGKLTGWVVPREKEGLLNLLSARQILESWRTKRLLPADVLNDALQTLEGRRALAHTHSAEGTPSATASGAAASSSSSSSKRRKKAGGEGFSTGETVRRMEEDRERHKRVRERLWVLPLPSAASTALSITPPSAFSSDAPRPPPPALASLLPSSVAGSTAYVLAAGAAGESPATSTTTPQSPFTPSPASTSLGGAGTRPVIRAAGPVDRGGLERAVDREFEAGWEDEGAWDEVDCGECQRENELCWPERIAGV